MKRILLIVCVFACCLKVEAQQNKDEFKEMVDSAVCLKYAQLIDAKIKRNNQYYLENLYLLNEQNQSLNYLFNANKLNLKYINVYDNRNKKIFRKGIYAWKVFTVLNNNKFEIYIVDFFITYKNHNYSFGNGGGSKITFEFNCDENRWKFISMENKGN